MACLWGARSPTQVESLKQGSLDAASSLDFPALLKRLRAEAGLSQQMLAGRALISVQAVSALERGYRKAPYRETLDRLADALALPADVRTKFEAAAARARGPRQPDPAYAAPAHNLPRRVTSFLGRDEVVAEIASLVVMAPLVTVVGTGGAGKTRAAIEVGVQLLDRFPNGVWFVEFAPLSDPALVVNMIAAVLGVQEQSGRPLLDTVVAYLEVKQLLLVLDNCEHVIGDVRRLAVSVLRTCPEVSILATSRETLNVAGERIYRIPPLAFPRDRATSARDAMSYGAVALFTDRALAADGRFVLSEENVAAVGEICRRLDGLPLAIELAAARVTVLSPRQLAQRLDHVFGILTGGSHSTLPRHQTMRALIDWSYGLLSSQARVLFDRLAIFAGGFTLDSAVAVCGDESLAADDILDLLSSLVDKSLVMADFSHVDARYHLLEATRQYALEKLTDRGERDSLAGRQALTYMKLAERLERDWYGASERQWFAEAESELDNCRAALEWSLAARRDVATGQRLAGALARVWYSLSAAEGRRWIDTALKTIGDDTPPAVVAQLHVADAELHGALGEYKASLAAAERGLAVARGVGDPLPAARARQTAGTALGALGRGSEGEALLHEALLAAQSLGNHRLRAMVLGDLGTARSRAGDVDGARRFYAEALAVYASRGFERHAASIAGHLAEVEFEAGDPAAALERAEEALRGHHAARNRRSVANDLGNMAAYLIALGRYDEARERAAEALVIAHELQATLLSAWVVQHLAAVFMLRPDNERAEAAQDRELAARLLGFVDSRLASLEVRREHTEQQEYDRMLIAMRRAFDASEFKELMLQGGEWSAERAVAQALEPD
jgi:predicted ATPase/transcriptional regulator with XRE-family HTH domain